MSLLLSPLSQGCSGGLKKGHFGPLLGVPGSLGPLLSPDGPSGHILDCQIDYFEPL